MDLDIERELGLTDESSGDDAAAANEDMEKELEEARRALDRKMADMNYESLLAKSLAFIGLAFTTALAFVFVYRVFSPQVLRVVDKLAALISG